MNDEFDNAHDDKAAHEAAKAAVAHESAGNVILRFLDRVANDVQDRLRIDARGRQYQVTDSELPDNVGVRYLRSTLRDMVGR